MTGAPRLISCDEAGYTGPNLTNAAQPVFAYAAHDLTEMEALDLVDRLRRGRTIQAQELKASGLRKRSDWPAIAVELLEALDGRVRVIVFDKRLALAGKAYEYLVEPVVQNNSTLFYMHGLHRIVAAAVHRSFAEAGGPAEAIAVELEAFMRSFDPATAPSLFRAETKVTHDARILRELLSIARGYRRLIEERTKHLRHPSDTGKWALDLTSTALATLLAGHFGQRYSRIEVLCDASKPLMAAADFFAAWIDRKEVVPIYAGNRYVPWRLDLAGPIVFGRSVDRPTLQVADLVAGVAAEVFGPAPRETMLRLRPRLERHLDENHILPNDEAFDPEHPLVRANLEVLRQLASRAALGRNPLTGMEKVYADALKHTTPPARRLKSISRPRTRKR